MTSRHLVRSALVGAASGAAGTTALNFASYLDMTWRARPASSTPEKTMEKLAELAGAEVPGEGEDRDNRLSGLGALSGIVTGVAVGAMYGVARGLGLRPPVAVGSLVATAAVLLASNGPMTALGITDPRTWGTSDWVSDVVPHLFYGVVTAATAEAAS
jgi:hypothetical protein